MILNVLNNLNEFFISNNFNSCYNTLEMYSHLENNFIFDVSEIQWEAYTIRRIHQYP